MFDPQHDVIDMKSCRICLSIKKPLCPLFKRKLLILDKLAGNYAEMLTVFADVKVAANDGLPEKICQKCCAVLEKAYLLKTVAERTDKKLRKILMKSIKQVPTKKIAFDSFTDIKSEIDPLSIKPEPKWEMEVDVLAESNSKPVETIDGKDVTVIRKLGANYEEPEKSDEDDNELEYLDEDVFQDDDDDDCLLPMEKQKTKYKKPKLL